MNGHCQEKKRFFKESVHPGTIGGTLSVIDRAEIVEKPANWGHTSGLVRWGVCLHVFFWYLP